MKSFILSTFFCFLLLGSSLGFIENRLFAVSSRASKTLLDAVSTESLEKEAQEQKRHATGHKKWGVDNKSPDEYWFDERIHTLGNTGVTGALHAALAPFSTKLIDVLAYDGTDIRKKVANDLSKYVNKGKARVLDLCCGVGISTRALMEAFPDAESVVGIDTSPEMLAMADFLRGHLSFFWNIVSRYNQDLASTLAAVKEHGKSLKMVAQQSCPYQTLKFARGNAQDTQLPDGSFDLVTIMYAFHEAPKAGRAKMVEEARRLLQPGGTLAVVDIACDYTPSSSMLAGEPYVLEYQKNIHSQMAQFKGFGNLEYRTLVPGHVGMWVLQRAPAAA